MIRIWDGSSGKVLYAEASKEVSSRCPHLKCRILTLLSVPESLILSHHDRGLPLASPKSLQGRYFDPNLLKDPARRTSRNGIRSDLRQSPLIDSIEEVVLGNGDLLAGSCVSVKSGKLERLGVSPSLSPLHSDPSITAKHRRIMVVGPIGKAPIKRSEKGQNFLSLHRSLGSHELNPIAKTVSDHLEIVVPQSLHVEKQGCRYSKSGIDLVHRLAAFMAISVSIL